MVSVCPVLLRQACSLHQSTSAFISLPHTSRWSWGCAKSVCSRCEGQEAHGVTGQPREAGALRLLLPCPSSSLCRFLSVVGVLMLHLMVTDLRAGPEWSCWGKAQFQA